MAAGRRLSRAGFVLVVAGGVALTLAAALIALVVGPAEIAPLDVVTTLAAIVRGEGADPVLAQIIGEIRLPRVIGALVTGGALAVVGTTLQAVMKNPLADPYVLGISSGASVGAALAVILGAHALGGPVATFAAFVTALVSVAVVYHVASVGGVVPAVRLLLAGVALSSFTTAVTGFLLYLAPGATEVRSVVFWLMGGLGASDWLGATWCAALALPACVVLYAGARAQNLLLLGDETALSLGLDVARTRGRLVAVAALATAAIVAFAGAIGFVGLVVPHALRPLTGPDHRRLIPAAFVFGALLLVSVDAVARVVIAPEELPVGILTGLLGAPFFLALLRRQGDEVRR
ncbi:iron ABC transporter permease [Myxococcota bacterium]|nr:iron ABC transporter permease [Myxococcota bacterium]